MRRLRLNSLVFLALALGRFNAPAEGQGQPDFKEVYDLVREHAAGVTEADLNRAAVQGLLANLGAKAWLATNTNGAPAAGASETPLVSRATLFDDGIAYLRIARVADGLAKALSAAYQQLNSTNRLKSLVLDLRYTGGMDYAAGAETADLFISRTRPLLNWGSGVVSSHEKSDAILVPVVVLANRETKGAAEALAAVLRTSGAGLILGARTSGRAMITKSFPLKTGGELRIATTPVSLGDGSLLSTDGVKPDIDVAVNQDDERAYYADAFYVMKRTNQLAGTGAGAAPAGTNATRRVRLNEAELVREHREGQDQDSETPRPRASEPEVPTVNDPALARALDLLKGLAVVRQSRS